MKIAHIADIHWGLGYPGPTPSARFDDICHVMNWTADKIIDEKCSLVIVAGDMFRKADISLDKASREIVACTAWLRKLTAAGIEVIIISGTPSHDPISAYELLKDYQLPLVSICTKPEAEFNHGLSIACLPGMDRSSFVNREEYRGRPAHVVHQMMTDEITAICQEMALQTGHPSVLVGHLTYDLCDKGFEDVLMQQEAILTQEAIEGYDLVCLGHIHRPQRNGTLFYSGSPERLSFNDEKVDAGFWIHEWNGKAFLSNYILTPARKFSTIRLDADQLESFISGGYDCWGFESHIVRVHFKCSEDLNKRLNRKQLEKALYDAGVFFVAEIKGDIERSDRMRDADVTETLGPVEAVGKWADNQGIEKAEIEELTAMTAQLMEVQGNA